MKVTQKAISESIRRSKTESFARVENGYGQFTYLLGLPAGLLIQWVKVPTKLGYERHEFVLRGPTGRRSPMNERGVADQLLRDVLNGVERFDVTYLMGEGADLNDAARIVRARATARALDESYEVRS